MYCPQCGKKFRFRNTFCPDCHVGLVEHPPPSAVKTNDDLALTQVFTTENAALVALAQSLLDGDNIEYMMRGATLRGFGVDAGPVGFWVRGDDAERAREILEDLRETSEDLPSPPKDEQ